MNKVIVLLMACLMVGCSSLTEAEREEREYKYVETRTLWSLCQQEYSSQGQKWYGLYPRHKHRPLQTLEMKHEIMHNGCTLEL